MCKIEVSGFTNNEEGVYVFNASSDTIVCSFGKVTKSAFWE